MNSNASRSPADLPVETMFGICIGDLVRTGVNDLPQYRVIAVTGDRAWIRDTHYGSDHIVPIDRCKTIRGSCS